MFELFKGDGIAESQVGNQNGHHNDDQCDTHDSIDLSKVNTSSRMGKGRVMVKGK